MKRYSIKTKSERLIVYKHALFHYRVSRFVPIIKWYLNCQVGLCWYFDRFQNIKHHSMKTDLPELYSVRPDFKNDNEYWFESGLLRPRIKLLKQAIKICKL